MRLSSCWRAALQSGASSQVAKLQCVRKLVLALNMSKTIPDHFRDPENSGALDSPTGTGESRNDACGDLLQLDVEVVDGIVERILFKARACSAVIGVASLMTSLARGRSIDEVRALDVAAEVERAGGVPPSKRHAIGMVERALAQSLSGKV